MSERRAAPTVLQISLGRRLRDLRESVGLSAAQAGERIRVAQSTVTRLEGARTSLNYATVKALLELYGVTGPEAADFLTLVDKANESGWWQSYRDVLPGRFGVYVSLESAASQIRSYEPQVVPGLLQTPAYCEAVIRLGFPRESDDEVRRRVALRLQRQNVLTRADSPPFLWAVIDETAIRRPAGDRAVMAEQIERLMETADLPNVALQLHPFEAGLHRGAFGPFTLFRFPIPDFPDIACVDSLLGTAYRDESAEVELYRQTFEHLMTGALARRRTKGFLDGLRKEYLR
ncbi:helix-turn-helix domain-containing protein [Streptomyces sp. NBC_00448]|uniref:helix-turn-helix domain-containing protein n=1 Tax=Streptomyces sp. NBC_00448 TaxID=2903652 RepID=UPI002E220FC5